MKFDFSTIFLIIVAVIPGIFAQRARNQLIPRSFAPQGPSAELAELVAFGVATHGVIAFLGASILLFFGGLVRHDPGSFFSELNHFLLGQWCSTHIVETALISFGYIFFSFFVSHCLGFIVGLLRLKSPITAALLAKATWLRKWFGVEGLLGERPIIYEVLNSGMGHETAQSVFVEIEMKDSRGFYSGQVSQFAIIRDEEPHKPIFLIDVWFKKERSDDYEQVKTDGLMLDLSETATLQVSRVYPSDEQHLQ